MSIILKSTNQFHSENFTSRHPYFVCFIIYLLLHLLIIFEVFNSFKPFTKTQLRPSGRNYYKLQSKRALYPTLNITKCHYTVNTHYTTTYCRGRIYHMVQCQGARTSKWRPF